MQQESEYAGYSFEPEETFEWSTGHKITAIRNSLAGLREECAAEAQVTEDHSLRDVLETAARVLGALETSFEKDFETGIIYSNKSDEPWD